MDVGKDQSHLKLHQTSEPHPQKSHGPGITGTWNLRNRELLRKRKAEAQEKQTSQWLLGEQKKRKYQRRGKGSQSGHRRQGHTESQPQPEEERVQEDTEPPEPPVTTEALPLVTSSTKAEPAEHCPEVPQESIQCQEIVIQNHSQTHQHRAKPEDLSPTTCQETVVLQHSSKMCQDSAEPEALSPKMYQEAAVPQTHFSEVPQDMAEPEALSPEMCQETAVPQTHPSKGPQDIAGPAISLKTCQEPTGLQEYTLKMCQDVAIPEVLSPATHEDMAVPKALPCTTPGDAAGSEGSSPEALPQSDVPEGCPTNKCPESARLERKTSHPDQGMGVTEDFFSVTEECNVSKDISTKTHPEAAEPEFISHETYRELTVATVSSHETIQESLGSDESAHETCQPTPGLENCSPETFREVLGPEDLSIKTRENRDGPKDCLPEGAPEVGGAQGPNPDARQDAEDAGTFSQEMKGGAKADQDPEIPACPQGPQENCPENDIYGYVLFNSTQ